MTALCAHQSEWRTLPFAPLWIMSSLAGMHRNFDPLEVEGLHQRIARLDRQVSGVPAGLERQVPGRSPWVTSPLP